MRLDLTNDEWMSLINADGEGLPRCCANISNVRDMIMSAARDNGVVLVPGYFAEKLEDAFGDDIDADDNDRPHVIPSDAMRKVYRTVMGGVK